MTYRTRRALFAALEACVLLLAAPFRVAGIACRFGRDRFAEGWAEGRTAWFTLRQARERYDTDDLIAEQSRAA